VEPFSISCTTCKSRLKVKNQAAVGQLLKCPKCGGMVLVKLPEEARPGDSASLRAETSPAIQKPIRPADAQDTLGENQDFNEVEALLATATPRSIPPATKPASAGKSAARDKTSRFADGEPAPPNGSANGTATGKAGGTSNGADSKELALKQAAPPVPGSEVLPLPNADWSSARPWKSWLFLAVSILLGMSLAFGVVTLSLAWFRDDTEVAEGPATEPSGESPPGETTPNPESPGDGTAKKSTPESPEGTKTPKEETKSPEKSKSPAPEAPSVAPPSGEDDPLGLGKKPAEETRPASPIPTNDPLAKFDRLVESRTFDPTAPAESAPPPKPAETPAEGPARPSLPRPAPRVVNVAARMNDPLPGLTITADEVHLADFLQSMQDFSTIPITLEPDNLAVFKLSADSRVPAFDGENLKFGAALAAVLAPLKLEAAVEDEQIIIRKPELIRDKMTRETRLMPVDYHVKDLVQDEKQATELAERIMALIEPGTWGDDDEDENACSLTPGKEKFAIRHRLSAHVQILTLCEKLRVARGLPPTQKGSDPETFYLATRTGKAAARLAAPVSATFNRPTPLVKICQKLSAAGKVRILIDWRSIAAAGWNPDAELTLVVDKKPLSEALAALVEPMDLAYRVVDGRTIQIVSPQVLAEHLELELHAVKELVSGQEQIEPLLARVRASLGEGAAGEPRGYFWLDAESKTLVTMLPQPKQQLLTRLLAEWRTKETN
jgi:hypothetical protein